MGAAGQTLVLSLYDDINPWSVRSLIDALRAAPGSPVLLRINSPGGSVTEGYALANALKAHDGPTTAVVEGLCASAATFPACACNVLQMHPESLFMIHAPWNLVEGNADELTSHADVLAKMTDLCVQLYRRKTKADEKLVREWLSKETWMTPSEAMAAGFCDEILTTPSSHAAQSRAARYLARLRVEKPKGKAMTLPDELRAKLAKFGLTDDGDIEQARKALAEYLESTEDGPEDRKAMRAAVSALEDDDDKDPDGETSSGDQMAKLRLRANASADPNVIKLVDDLTGRIAQMEQTERARAESDYMAEATRRVSQEDARFYANATGKDYAAALKICEKFPLRSASALGRTFSGGSPAARSGAPMPAEYAEKTKTIKVGAQTAHLYGHAFSAKSKALAAEKNIPLAQAQLEVARKHPELLQK